MESDTARKYYTNLWTMKPHRGDSSCEQANFASSSKLFALHIVEPLVSSPTLLLVGRVRDAVDVSLFPFFSFL